MTSFESIENDKTMALQRWKYFRTCIAPHTVVGPMDHCSISRSPSIATA